jgi:hypothetical protein
MLLFQTEPDRLGYRLDLAVRASGGQQQIIGKRGYFLDFQNSDVESLFFKGVGCAKKSSFF